MSQETAPTELAAENWGNPDGDIMSAMDKFFEQEGQAPTDIIAPPEPQTPEPAPTKPDAVPASPVEAVKVVELAVPTMDEEFFSDAPQEPVEDKADEVKPGDFDEKAFDAETDTQIKGMSEKAGERFKALKAELKEFKLAKPAIPAEVQAKLAELDIKSTEVEGLKAQLAEVSGESAALKVKTGEKYRTEVLEPVADIFSRADVLVETYEGDEAAKELLKSIIKTRDRKTQNELVSEHLKDFSDLDRSEVYRLIQDFNGALGRHEKMLSQAEKEVEADKVRRIESEKQALNAQRVAVQTHQRSIWDKYKEVIPGFVDDNGETPAFKQLVAKGLSIDFSQAKAPDMAFAAFAGSALPHMVKEYGLMRAKLAAYEKADATLVKTAPKTGASLVPTTGEKKPKDFMEAMAADYAFTH